MWRTMVWTGVLFALVTVLMPGSVARGGEGSDDRFYKAYYLEHAEGNLSKAADLYEKVAADRGARGDVQSQAKIRLASVREEIASSDFTRLMPPNALVYVELMQPGEQLMKLLDQLGILSDGGLPPAIGGRHIAVSPNLIRETLGVRGVAVAITGFNPMKGQPSGVLVFDHGDLDVVRGLIETGLPATAKLVEPIGGFPTYDIEGEALITLTSRLVVASTERSQINNVVRRLKGELSTSLADSDLLRDYGADGDDSLVFFAVNAKAVMPMVKGAMAAGGDGREMAMADAILDLDSLQSLTGQVRVGDDGLRFDLSLRLDEGHRNLVYNFLRTPPVSRDTLRCVPAGVAAFAVGALNEAPSRFGGDASADDDAPPVVTALDFGREVFANITSFALFVLPSDENSAYNGLSIPDVGLVLTVNDPSKSRALWTQVLGIASLASGAGVIEGSVEEIEGVSMTGYKFPDDYTVYFGASGNDVLIANSRSAVQQSIVAKRDKRSVLNDAAFASSLQALDANTTKGLFVHAGRCAEIAHGFAPPADAAEMEKFMGRLDNTVAAVMVKHSDETFRISASLSGIPKIGDVLAQLIDEKMSGQESDRRLRHAMRDEDWDSAAEEIDSRLSENPKNRNALETKFQLLAKGKRDHDAAARCADQLLDAMGNDAKGMNNFAWGLLTEDGYGGGYAEVALKFAERSNELTERKNWMFVDTLALATFETGDAAGAIALENRAIELSGGVGGDAMTKTLARFEAARTEATVAEGNY